MNRSSLPVAAALAVMALAVASLIGCTVPGPGPSPSTTTSPPPAPWVPAPGTTFQIQFTGTPVDTTVSAQVFDVDGFDTEAAVVTALHGQGRKAVCYLSAGSWEDWRPDASQYPAVVLGNALDGWPGERWVDIRRQDLLGPIFAARFDMCKAKGFDAVDPDNVDGYANDTGFPLTANDQLSFNRFLADLAHQRGMSIGLKNDLDQVPALVDRFDFAINEQCAEYDECSLVSPFITAGKAVFELEYTKPKAAFCPQSVALGFSAMRKNLSLDAFRDPC